MMFCAFNLVIYFATERFNVSPDVSHYNSIESAPSLQLMLCTAVAYIEVNSAQYSNQIKLKAAKPEGEKNFRC